MILTWEQKLMALQAIDPDIAIKMRAPGDWYVDCCMEVKTVLDSAVLNGHYGNGVSPEEAIHDHWRQVVEDLPVTGFIVVGASSQNRKQYRWNRFMWKELP